MIPFSTSMWLHSWRLLGRLRNSSNQSCSQPWADSCASTACSNTLKDSWTWGSDPAFSINTVPMSRGSAPFLAKLTPSSFAAFWRAPSKSSWYFLYASATETPVFVRSAKTEVKLRCIVCWSNPFAGKGICVYERFCVKMFVCKSVCVYKCVCVEVLCVKPSVCKSLCV